MSDELYARVGKAWLALAKAVGQDPCYLVERAADLATKSDRRAVETTEKATTLRYEEIAAAYREVAAAVRAISEVTGHNE